MAILYVITREGIYRHEIIGIYTDLTEAREAAESAMLAEADNYHSILLSKCLTNTAIGDVEPIATYSRKNRSPNQPITCIG